MMNDLERKEYYSYISDAYKDVYGVRPRHFYWEDMEDEDLIEIADNLSVEVAKSIEREKERAEECAVNFENAINDMMVYGAESREDAIRWFLEANEMDSDAGYIMYRFGLPNRYYEELAEVLG